MTRRLAPVAAMKTTRIDTEATTGTTGTVYSKFYLFTPTPKRSLWSRVAAFLGICAVVLVCGLVPS